MKVGVACVRNCLLGCCESNFQLIPVRWVTFSHHFTTSVCLYTGPDCLTPGGTWCISNVLHSFSGRRKDELDMFTDRTWERHDWSQEALGSRKFILNEIWHIFAHDSLIPRNEVNTHTPMLSPQVYSPSH